ncbi:Suppressor protein stp22 of temperature-sensitive alpha-factor receptor and arginine permease [Gnomoniopsis smithogilvyi]|uniref:Suppressor protein stp22 of temperature-sensitive alpha-factor receptor and arginine permease n=1 Tax=Gnomoniopsis smithogilvyi TaxID=1191159 RepID=A0A9W9D1Q8_9PEZI|nr:Suppressor protein stp22 of temperature-sensitive alpha-factor receptor and arginine permease [Gnomoniopsis smithogilvyi]
MVVQQHVLNWLYSVLTSEYHDVNRTYNDVAQALSQYPSLLPRTDVHTFPNGSSALLLHLSGTIPVNFRGTTYRFPVSLWVPHAYPREAPFVYVTPTETMVVRPGQHVDPQGQVYHPYLVGWADFWDKSNILDFLAILRDVFAKEPPVIARGAAQRPPPAHPQATPTPPPVPPLPQELSARPSSSVHSSPIPNGHPPPPPPKPHQQSPRADGAPPLPPLPPGAARPSSQYGLGMQSPAPAPAPAPNNRLSRYESAPPLPPQAHTPQQLGPPQTHPPTGPPVPQNAYQGPPQGQYQAGSQQPPMPSGDPQRNSNIPPQAYSQYPGPPPHTQQQQYQQWQQQQQQQGPPPPQAAPPQPKQKPPPPPDLMDEPLTLNIPSPSSVPAPPIPPNPEKDALLHQLAITLHQTRMRTREQNESSLQGLQAQRTAMLNAMSTMQSEIGALAQLSNLLQNNTNILQDTMRRADEVIQNSTRLPEPDVDQLLVAPTVVANQLYDLVAEERALADAIFVLGRAVERGRVAPAVFAKTTRSLAREWYLKKALVKKIGRGMQLTA